MTGCVARSACGSASQGGYSTFWLALALAPGGRVVTLEADPHHADIAHANIARAGLADRIEIRVGWALETLPELAAEGRGPFDLIFVDADKESSTEYFMWGLRLSRAGTVLVVDNVVRGGEVAESTSDDPRVQGVRRVMATMAAEPRVSATVIQTVGLKGYDGFALAVVLA